MPENVNTSVLEIDDLSSAKDNRPTMIKVDHISMVFNKASEQLNSLKEYAIELVKRELFFEGFKALDNISFEVKKGDVFGIMGTNGSGKSTMLKIIAGVLEPSSGTCEINGNIVPLIELGAGFDMELTARENIYLNGALLGYSKEFINEHFDGIVDFAEIESFLDMPLKNYSSGMVARIAFAIATVIVPEILVVDEVLSVGDFMFQKKCEDRISELIEKHGVTVLIVSHSNEQISRLCNKAIWIEKGHTRLLGGASMVTRVYGGLGGRTGSDKAEKIVFEALAHMEMQESSWLDSAFIQGENSVGRSIDLVLKGWSECDIDVMVLACNDGHINAIVANAFAASFDAPVLPVDPDGINNSLERLLYSARSKKLFFFDLGNHGTKVLDRLSDLPWKKEVECFGRNLENPLEFSLQVFEYGAVHGIWKDDAMIVYAGDNLESLIASPYCYAMKCPVIVVSDDTASYFSIASTLVNAGVKNAIVLGRLCSELDGAWSGINRVFVSDENGNYSCRVVSSFVVEGLANIRKDPCPICVGVRTMAQWPALLSMGCYLGKFGTGLYLMDEKDLDDMAAFMDIKYEHRNKISDILFIGGQPSLSEITRLLCAWNDK